MSSYYISLYIYYSVVFIVSVTVILEQSFPLGSKKLRLMWSYFVLSRLSSAIANNHDIKHNCPIEKKKQNMPLYLFPCDLHVLICVRCKYLSCYIAQSWNTSQDLSTRAPQGKRTLRRKQQTKWRWMERGSRLHSQQRATAGASQTKDRKPQRGRRTGARWLIYSL